MKTLLTALLLTSSVGAFANHHEDWDKLPFDEAKKMKLEMLDKKIATMTEARACVNGAKDKDALKACHNEMMKEKHEMKAKMRQSQEDK